MNKVILMGRLVKDPEVRYTQEHLAVARYTLAVNKKVQQGQAEADFIPCIAFGKTAQVAENYFNKGRQIAIVGRLQIRSWENESGQRQWTTEIVVEEQYFTGSKNQESNHQQTYSYGNSGDGSYHNPTTPKGFYPVSEEEDLAF